MGQRRADPGGGRGRLNDATQTRRAPKGGRPRRVLPALCAALFAWPLSAQTPEFGAGVQRPAEVRIGVLAHRGWGREAAGWAPLAAHLDAALPGRSVRLVPVTLSSAGPLIDRGGLHFLVTNPGHDVALDREHRLSPIATRLRRLSDGSRTTEFGSALVVRADSPLETLEDTAGARAAAVDPRAFGGYRLAWRALTERGVDPARDFAELAFLGVPQDRIVEAVLKGEADLGIVRSGLLERMEAEGAVPEGALRVLNANVTTLIRTRSAPGSIPSGPSSPWAARSGRCATGWRWRCSRPGRSRPCSGARRSATATRARCTRPSRPRRRRHPGRAAPGSPGRARSPRSSPSWRSWVGGRCAAPALPEGGADPMARLTRRERQVLDRIAEGGSTKEIAQALGISPKTVEFHHSNLLKEFEARNSAQLAVTLRARGAAPRGRAGDPAAGGGPPPAR